MNWLYEVDYLKNRTLDKVEPSRNGSVSVCICMSAGVCACIGKCAYDLGER